MSIVLKSLPLLSVMAQSHREILQLWKREISYSVRMLSARVCTFSKGRCQYRMGRVKRKAVCWIGVEGFHVSTRAHTDFLAVGPAKASQRH